MVQMEEIRGWMSEDGISTQFVSPEDPDRVAMPIPADGRMVWVVVTVEESNRYIRLNVPGMATLPSGKKARAAVLMALMAENRERKLVKFGIDPVDGEICAEVGIAVQDGVFTHDALRRNMTSLIVGVRDAWGVIDQAQYGKKAAGTGGGHPTAAGLPSPAEFDSFLEQLMAGLSEADAAAVGAGDGDDEPEG